MQARARGFPGGSLLAGAHGWTDAFRRPPPTPPCVWFRRRRFMKRAVGGDAGQAMRSARACRSKPFGRRRSCGWPQHSTRGLVRRKRTAVPAPRPDRVASVSLPGFAGHWRHRMQRILRRSQPSRSSNVPFCGSVPLPQVAADDATVTWPYKRRMYHAATLPTGRTANNMQSSPTVR
jgi:hypothetical protein